MTLGNYRFVSLRQHIVLSFALGVSVLNFAGCGSTTKSLPTGTNTAVTLLATSTADDRLTQFTMALSSLSLVSRSGNEVPVIMSPMYAEFIHLNGVTEPLLTAQIPQGTYTSAIASVGFSMFNCVQVSQQGGINGLGIGGGNVKSDKVAIQLPSPIEISGNATTLVLNMLAGPSSSNAVCENGINSFAVKPSFELAQKTTTSDATFNNLQGVVETVNSDGSLVVSSIDGPALSFTNLAGKTASATAAQWDVNTTAGTEYSGIEAGSSLAPGLPVDMDVVLQNGALTATRISVYDANTASLNLFNGPLLSASTATAPEFDWVRGGVGNPQQAGLTAFSLTGARFGVSPVYKNLESLPFTARFDEATFIWGQTVDVSTHQPLYQNSYLPVTTVTLLPQTVNGAVQAISTSGNFTTYTITLQSYDLFPQLALQWGQGSHLNSPNVITVYADKNVQAQTLVPIAQGGIYRFHGLIFNDEGVLRMDCGSISDGVID